MKEYPIILSGPEARAFLEGRKTQIRTPVKPQPPKFPGWWKKFHWANEKHFQKGAGDCTPWRVGDVLWVKETCYITGVADDDGAPLCIPPVVYAADGATKSESYPHVRSSITMPRWASRLSLEITGIRVEQVQNISDEDRQKEGVFPDRDCCWCKGTGYEFVDCQNEFSGYDYRHRCRCEYQQFIDYWNSRYTKKGLGWDVNPLVWTREVRRVKCTE